ncbi:o-succinylbenzoate--CoA ligase [Mycolicibacterium litorale]|uniref:o-succinylbenzoate--CoA ligase n=1 Tax=Mycolicibacterium litorale TaxID=758802 RepID=UPI003CEE4A56
MAGRGPALLPTPAADPDEGARLSGALGVGAPIDDDVAVVVPTSGTTGTPKGAMLTAAALAASAEATHTRLGGAGRWLLALPAHHIAGLQVLVRSVVAGERPVALAANFDPEELVASAASMGAGRRYVSLVSVQLDKVLRSPAATAALATFDAVLIGGGPMPPELAERASAAGVSVVRTYGMSETAGGCVYDGVPLDGVRVRLDEARILLGGPTLAKGYRNPVQPDPFTEPGWFRTDDVGALDEAGVLRVLGRVDDAISSGGLTVMPPVVEAVLSRHPALADCAVFGVADDRLGQRVVAAIVVAAGATAPTVAELRAHVAAELDATAAPREVHVVDEVPRRGIGKVDRRKLSAQYS